jgi:3-hydroxyacyl-CoA dehydrogenase
MSNPVSIRMLGRVAVLSMDRPPRQQSGFYLRAGILAALDQVNADPAVQIIVLTGTARAFSQARTSWNLARRWRPASQGLRP